MMSQISLRAAPSSTANSVSVKHSAAKCDTQHFRASLQLTHSRLAHSKGSAHLTRPSFKVSVAAAASHGVLSVSAFQRGYATEATKGARATKSKKEKQKEEPVVEEKDEDAMVEEEELGEAEDVVEQEKQQTRLMEMENFQSQSQVEDVYQKKTPVEHVLLRPDTYIGGIFLHIHAYSVLRRRLHCCDASSFRMRRCGAPYWSSSVGN
jgi:hypothetical protein